MHRRRPFRSARRLAKSLTILALPGLTDLAPYLDSQRPAGTSRGFSFVGSDGAFIVLAWEAQGDPWIALAHEYAHLVHPEPDGPAWLREGFAEYLSRLRRDADEELRAIPAPHHARDLQSQRWMPLLELLEATSSSPAFARPLFYAQSWLIFDWLAATETPADRLLEATFQQRLSELGLQALELELRAHASRPAASRTSARWPPIAA